jgi:ketopantoate reductase
MAAFAAEVLPTGIVRFTVNQSFYLGELPEGTSGRIQTLVNTLESAGIQAKVTPHIQSLECSNYVAFVSAMVPGVLTRLETYQFLQNTHLATVGALKTAVSLLLGHIPTIYRHRMTRHE